MNATQPPSKRSSIERGVDYIIFFMFALLFSMCITGCIYFAWWTSTYMPLHWNLAPDRLPGAIEYNSQRPAIVGVTNFITSFILYGEHAAASNTSGRTRWVGLQPSRGSQNQAFTSSDQAQPHEQADSLCATLS